jgi:hypothetical protein
LSVTDRGSPGRSHGSPSNGYPSCTRCPCRQRAAGRRAFPRRRKMKGLMYSAWDKVLHPRDRSLRPAAHHQRRPQTDRSRIHSWLSCHTQSNLGPQHKLAEQPRQRRSRSGASRRAAPSNLLRCRPDHHRLPLARRCSAHSHPLWR